MTSELIRRNTSTSEHIAKDRRHKTTALHLAAKNGPDVIFTKILAKASGLVK